MMKFAIGGFATTVFALVTIATAAPAAAGPEADFLEALANGGVSYPASVTSRVVSGGHTVCQGLASGDSYKDAIAGVAGAMGGNSHLADVFVRAATSSFCPSYLSTFP
jgi:hypothetical protein